MHYSRSLTTSARLLVRQGVAPAFSCPHHDHDHKNLQHSDEKTVKRGFLRSRSFGNNTNCWSFGDPKQYQFLHVTSGLLLARNMSTSDGTMEAVSNQAAAVSEVVVAAADSWPPVAALQHVIDGIHVYTGLNWWASIVIATLVIKSMTIPFMIKTSKLLDAWEYVREKDDGGFEHYIRMERLRNEHGVFPTKQRFIQGTVFVSFYLAIEKMVEKVPSFQTGGILWFTDLTAIDRFRVLPFVAAISFWSHMHDRSTGSPNLIKAKYSMLISFSALTTPFAANFPNALLCYWITSNLFIYVYKLMIKKPSVKELLNIEAFAKSEEEEIKLRSVRRT